MVVGRYSQMRYGRQRKKLQSMLNEGTLKRKINGKLFYTTENIINSYGYK
jgi:hypothetical protein